MKRAHGLDLGDQDRERLWPQLIGRAPFFEGYQKRTTRQILMARLQPADESRDR